MKTNKKIIISFFVVFFLLSTTMLATALSIEKNIIEKKINSGEENIEIYVGKMTIDGEWDSIACKIDVIDSPYEKINVINEEKATLKFYIEWEIINEKLSKEKWEFKLILKDGNSPDSTIIDSKELIIEDSLALSDEGTGEIYLDDVLLSRDDFEKDDFFQRPEVRKFRLELECKYYEGKWIDNNLNLLSDADLWTVARIDLENEKPTIPSLSGDIGEGETGDVDKTYTFTAESSVDPDGDIIRYVFFWNDGTSDETEYVESGGVGTKSHTWDKKGHYEVSVYAQDRFGAISPSATLKFELPRNKNIFKSYISTLFFRNKIFNKLCFIIE